MFSDWYNLINRELRFILPYSSHAENCKNGLQRKTHCRPFSAQGLINQKFSLFPASGEIVKEDNHANHVARNGTAEPEAVQPHIHCHTEQERKTDSGHDAVGNAAKKTELRIADAVQERECGGAGGKA